MPKSRKATEPEATEPEPRLETMGEYLKRNGGKRPEVAPKHGFAVSTMGEYLEASKAEAD